MEIFKAYDIRGIYPSELDEKKAFRIGRSIATLANGKTLYMNIDTRLGSKMIKENFVGGMLESGGNIVDLGMGTIMEAAVASYKNDAFGISLTASHNPAEYAGIIAMEKGVTVDPQSIKGFYLSGRFSAGKGTLAKEDFKNEYISLITKGVSGIGLKVGIDSMGGSTTHIIKSIMDRIGCEYSAIYDVPSETFYGRHPEPKEENSKDLSVLVVEDGLDFGVQFDADGDRIGIVDEEGRFINPNLLGLIFIKYNNYKKVVADFSFSRIIEKYASVKYERVGHRFIEAELMRHGYPFALESSAHFYFGEYHPFSDGLLSAVMFARILKESGKKASEIVDSMPKVYYDVKGLKFNSDKDRDSLMAKIESRVLGMEGVERLDGIKIKIGGGFALFRKSNTEPLVKVYCDAQSAGELAEIIKKAEALCSG